MFLAEINEDDQGESGDPDSGQDYASTTPCLECSARQRLP